MRFTGLFHPLVTPFTPDGDVDPGAIARNAQRAACRRRSPASWCWAPTASRRSWKTMSRTG